MMLLIFLAVVAWATVNLVRARQHAEIRKVDPAAYAKLQEIEQEKQAMRLKSLENTASTGVTVLRILLKR